MSVDINTERELLVRLGEAMAVSGESVAGVRDRLSSIARARHLDDVKLVVLPTSLWVQTGTSDSTNVEFTSFANRAIRLDQVSEVYAVASLVHDPAVPASTGLEDLRRVLSSPAPFGSFVRSIGLGVLAAGFSLSLQPSIGGAVAALVLGFLVGLLKLVRTPSIQATMPVIAAFVVALVVFGLADTFDAFNPLRVLIPPLVTFLPGAALTTGMRDIAAGQIVSGSSRLVQGVVELLMLAVGVVAATALVGAPSSQLLDRPFDRLGPWAPWIGLVLIALGTRLHRCALRSSLPWILLVLVVTYAAQLAASVVFGAELSAFFGALVMTAATLWIERRPHGPPALVTYLPAFWVLVPGAAGLIGMTEIVGVNSKLGVNDFFSTLATVTEIALGVLIGTTAFQATAESVPELARALPVPREVRRWWHRGSNR